VRVLGHCHSAGPDYSHLLLLLLSQEEVQTHRRSRDGGVLAKTRKHSTLLDAAESNLKYSTKCKAGFSEDIVLFVCGSMMFCCVVFTKVRFDIAN
jgi:hypothetical protein